jgi:hypothetical protein
MKKVVYLEVSNYRASDVEKSIITCFGEYVRSICKGVTGPFRLDKGWVMNCKFRETEFWLLIKRRETGLVVEVDSVWDLHSFFKCKLENPDLAMFEIGLSSWTGYQHSRTAAGSLTRELSHGHCNSTH